jgi:hypothetical protein
MVLLLGLLFFLASWVFVGQHTVGANVGITSSDNWVGGGLHLINAPSKGQDAS